VKGIEMIGITELIVVAGAFLFAVCVVAVVALILLALFNLVKGN
jgi:hypothetical protein